MMKLCLSIKGHLSNGHFQKADIEKSVIYKKKLTQFFLIIYKKIDIIIPTFRA